MKRLFSSFVRYIKRFFVKIDFADLVKNHEAQVLDVRTQTECDSHGFIQNSINIPLDSLRLQLSKLDTEKPVIICCANGIRSGLAREILLNNGFKSVYRAGGFESLKRKLKSDGC